MHTLRIQSPASLGRLLLAHSLPRFAHMHTGLRIELLDAPSNGATLSRDADAALCIGTVADSRLIVRRVGTVRFVACASPEFVDRHGLPKAPADLDPTHCIALLEPRSHRPQEWLFRKGPAQYTIWPTGPLAFSDAQSTVAAAMRGGGYVRVLSIEADQCIAAGLLQPVLDEWNEGTL